MPVPMCCVDTDDCPTTGEVCSTCVSEVPACCEEGCGEGTDCFAWVPSCCISHDDCEDEESC